MANMISNTDVRTVCMSKVAYEVEKFAPYIEPAELEFIKPFLGLGLYAEIKSQYTAGSLSEANTILINNYLKKALAWFTMHKALPFIQMDISNSGIMINNSEYASSGTDKQRADLVTEALNNGNLYLREAKDFLEHEDQDGDYPLYEASENITNDTNIIGGLILDTDD